MSVNLEKVVEAIEHFDEYDDNPTYYYRKKDKLIDRNSEEWINGEAQRLVFYGSDEMVLLPSAKDLDEYSILENFVLQLDDRYASAILYNCIQGKGAFKRFKETCDLLGLLPAYWDFQHKEHIQIAREFCENYDIDYYEENDHEMTYDNQEVVSEDRNVMDVIRKFVSDRDWDQFHSPENLAKSISIESSELLECFQWDGESYDLGDVKEELADVMIYCLQMCDKLHLDPEKIMLDKMDKNAAKYPVNKAKGNATKYNKF